MNTKTYSYQDNQISQSMAQVSWHKKQQLAAKHVPVKVMCQGGNVSNNTLLTLCRRNCHIIYVIVLSLICLLL